MSFRISKAVRISKNREELETVSTVESKKLLVSYGISAL